MDALETVVQNRRSGVGVALLAAGAAMLGGIEEGIGLAVMTVGLFALAEVYYSSILPVGVRPALIKKANGEKWKIADFHNAEIRERFGFDSVLELQRFYNVLGYPEKLRIGRGADSKKYEVESEQPFLYMLERDHCGTKLSLMEFTYGDSYNSIGEQALAAERWLVDTHGHRLSNLGAFVDRFPMYAEAIRNRIEVNDPLPPEGSHLIGFLDRVSIRIGRPVGNWAFQRLFFNWKSQYHCLAYQSLYAPDGMHIHFWGPKAGKHNDRLLLAESGLNTLLENLQRLPNGILPALLFGAYTDRGYDENTCIRAAHHGPLTTVLQIMYNNIMSPVRVAVEWGFARIRAMSKLLHSSWNMHLQAEAVDIHVKSAVLLSNARTTLRGAQAVKRFVCVPPTLEAYFA